VLAGSGHIGSDIIAGISYRILALVQTGSFLEVSKSNLVYVPAVPNEVIITRDQAPAPAFAGLDQAFLQQRDITPRRQSGNRRYGHMEQLSQSFRL